MNDAQQIPPLNPYHPNDPILAPFAGRQKAFEFLYARLTDPEGAGATLVMGRRDGGKTTLLRRFDSVFEESFVSLYLALNSTPLSRESDWLRAVTEATGMALTARDFTLSRLPDMPVLVTRNWFEHEFLPEVFTILRRGRRLALLLDDVDALIQSVDAGQLPEDSFTWLNELLEKHSELRLVLALDAAAEDQVSRLSPLIGLTNIFRLGNLAPDETTWLMNASGHYSLTAEAAAAVQRATGGQPRLAQRFGAALYQRWSAESSRLILNGDDVKAVTPTVYQQSEAELKTVWGEATRNERLVLTAISSLLYADPLRPVTVDAVESWLVETDYPLDSTAIHAAARGLEYREIIEVTAGHLTISAGMMQTWLLDNARFSEGTAPPAANRRWLRWAIAAGVVVLIVVLVAIGTGSSDAPPPAPQPTITLIGNP